MIVSFILGINQLKGIDLILLTATFLLYLLAVQLPTVLFNIPLNNRLQNLKLDQLSDNDLHAIRDEFENKWNRWNIFRTIISILVSILLIFLSIRL